MYNPKEIEKLSSKWRGSYRQNDDLGQFCKRFVYGDQWSQADIRSRNERSEESIIFNLLQKEMSRVKGESQALELGLDIHVNPNTVDENIVKEGRAILEKIILCNDHLHAFREVLNQVFDHGYGALLVTTKLYKEGEPSEIPHLTVVKDVTQCFWDVECETDFKIDGRYCGINYEVDRREFFPKVSSLNGEKVRVTDFWYREKKCIDWSYTQNGKWVQGNLKNALARKKISDHQVKFMRIADGEVVEGPVDYYTRSLLPLVYWKGEETTFNDGNCSRVKTVPFSLPLLDVQTMINCIGSAITSRVKKLGSTKYIMTPSMVRGKESFFKEFTKLSGVVIANENEDNSTPQPIVLPPEPLDGTLLNAFSLALQVMDTLSGATPAQSGEQGSPTNAGLHRQIMQANILRNVIKDNHLRAINVVGKILKEMVPQVMIEERDIGGGFIVNKKGPLNTPSSPQIINDLNILFSKLDFQIKAGPSSEAQKAAHQIMLKELFSTNPQLAQFFGDAFVESFNVPNIEDYKRRMSALMPPGIQEVGEGTMSIDEFRKMQQEQQQQMQQQQNGQSELEREELELERQKINGDQLLRQEEINIKKQKLQSQMAKDSKNLQIKEVQAVGKLNNANG